MAHAQEHMMFRGSPGLSADQLADIGSVMGGNFNADTRESLTQYLYTVPADDLDVALHIEALRMQGVSIASRAGSRSAARSSRRWHRTCPIPITCCTKSCVRWPVRRHTLRSTMRSALDPRFERTTAEMLQALPRHLVRAEQRHSDHRRGRRAERDLGPRTRAVRRRLRAGPCLQSPSCSSSRCSRLPLGSIRIARTAR